MCAFAWEYSCSGELQAQEKFLSSGELFFTDRGWGRKLERFLGVRGVRVEQLPPQESNGLYEDGLLVSLFLLPSLPFPLWSLIPVWPHAHSVGDSLEFLIHLFYWNYMYVSPHTSYVVLDTKPSALWVLGKTSAKGAHNPALVFFTKQRL